MSKITPFLVFLGFLVLLSCRREQNVLDRGVNLRFSADTVFLDTVFSTVGSSTYTLKVYNPENEIVQIDNIRLERGSSSAYRLNVDGRATKNINDVEILPEDSIYIFVEVTAPEINTGDPLYIDKILFENKGTSQDVELVTLARDVHFHKPTNFLLLGSGVNQVSLPYSVVDCDDVWINDKPHVVYGYALIDANCNLTINPGSEIYFHDNAGLLVSDFAQLDVAQGAIVGIDDSVIFAGDRLEPFYENVPGQWGGVLGGIYIAQRGRANINLSNIKNAETAIRLDSAANSEQLSITNSYILNSSRVGLFGGYGRLDARNLVIANSGLHCFYAFAGNYEFRNCTFANFWNQSTRNTPSVLLTNFIEFQNENGQIQRIVRDIESCYFGNCIIDGNNNQEFSLANDETGLMNYRMNNALVKMDRDAEDRGYDVSDASIFTNLLINRDPMFIDAANNFYDLDTASQAIDQGNTADAILLNSDILGRLRNIGNAPDLGAFEYQGN
jgi:hypothetical protein